MPYELSFRKKVAPADPDQYFNECCVGGDVVSARLLPQIEERYTHVRADQEDWGWFVWFRSENIALAVDICCDDPEAGDFRVHLTSRRRRRLLPAVIEDTPELEDVRALVVSSLEGWVEGPVRVARLDSDYM